MVMNSYHDTETPKTAIIDKKYAVSLVFLQVDLSENNWRTIGLILFKERCLEGTHSSVLHYEIWRGKIKQHKLY